MPDNPQTESSASVPVLQPIPASIRVLLWVCIGAWVISFFLPAVKIDGGKGGTGAGWAIAFDALVLLIVPVKGAWLGLFPSLWTVFINLFMLLAPWQIKRMEKGEGRGFAMLFSIATALPILLAYLPPSLGAVGLGFPLLVGFYVWEFSMIVVAALFMRVLWGDDWGYAPATVLSILLFCLPIRRGEWNFAPSQQKPVTTAVSRSLPAEMPGSMWPTTIIIASSPNPSLSGEPVTFTARVSVPWGEIPSGTVSFTDFVGNRPIGSVHTKDGTAIVSTSELSSGEHGIRVNFVPDASDRYLSSEQSSVQMVNKPKQGKFDQFWPPDQPSN